MYQRSLASRATCAALLCGALVSNAANASILARYDFDDASNNFANVADNGAPHLTASAWSAQTGSLTSGAGVSGFALTARSFKPQNQLSITLTPEQGYTLKIDQINFNVQATAAGPKTWRMTLNAADIGNGTTHPSFTAEQITIGGAGAQGPLQLALIGSDASSAAGLLRLDNFEISGSLSAVPLPAAAYLFASAALLAVRRQRKCSEMWG